MGPTVELVTSKTCPACHQYAPEWAQVVKVARKLGYQTRVIDVTTCNKKAPHAIYTPFVSLTRGNQRVVYNGSRTAQGTIEFLRNHM